jgi:NAD-dependent SIR2 family protein deacetylase
MKLVKMNNPREGQRVQCSKCFKMIPAKDAIADLDAPANTFYHKECLPLCNICNDTGINPDSVLRNCTDTKCSCQYRS